MERKNLNACCTGFMPKECQFYLLCAQQKIFLALLAGLVQDHNVAANSRLEWNCVISWFLIYWIFRHNFVNVCICYKSGDEIFPAQSEYSSYTVPHHCTRSKHFASFFWHYFHLNSNTAQVFQEYSKWTVVLEFQVSWTKIGMWLFPVFRHALASFVALILKKMLSCFWYHKTILGDCDNLYICKQELLSRKGHLKSKDNVFWCNAHQF